MVKKNIRYKRFFNSIVVDRPIFKNALINKMQFEDHEFLFKNYSRFYIMARWGKKNPTIANLFPYLSCPLVHAHTKTETKSRTSLFIHSRSASKEQEPLL